MGTKQSNMKRKATTKQDKTGNRTTVGIQRAGAKGRRWSDEFEIHFKPNLCGTKEAAGTARWKQRKRKSG